MRESWLDWRARKDAEELAHTVDAALRPGPITLAIDETKREARAVLVQAVENVRTSRRPVTRVLAFNDFEKGADAVLREYDRLMESEE